MGPEPWGRQTGPGLRTGAGVGPRDTLGARKPPAAAERPGATSAAPTRALSVEDEADRNNSRRGSSANTCDPHPCPYEGGGV